MFQGVDTITEIVFGGLEDRHDPGGSTIRGLDCDIQQVASVDLRRRLGVYDRSILELAAYQLVFIGIDIGEFQGIGHRAELGLLQGMLYRIPGHGDIGRVSSLIGIYRNTVCPCLAQDKEFLVDLVYRTRADIEVIVSVTAHDKGLAGNRVHGELVVRAAALDKRLTRVTAVIQQYITCCCLIQVNRRLFEVIIEEQIGRLALLVQGIPCIVANLLRLGCNITGLDLQVNSTSRYQVHADNIAISSVIDDDFLILTLESELMAVIIGNTGYVIQVAALA